MPDTPANQAAYPLMRKSRDTLRAELQNDK
jgi:hypothetical protein